MLYYYYYIHLFYIISYILYSLIIFAISVPVTILIHVHSHLLPILCCSHIHYCYYLLYDYYLYDYCCGVYPFDWCHHLINIIHTYQCYIVYILYLFSIQYSHIHTPIPTPTPMLTLQSTPIPKRYLNITWPLRTYNYLVIPNKYHGIGEPKTIGNTHH